MTSVGKIPRRLWPWLCLTTGVCLTGVSALGGGLQTRFAKAVVEGLPVGCSTGLRLASGERYSVENTGDRALEVGLRIVRPAAEDVRASGYLPIPDVGWVALGTNRVVIPSRGKAEVDITISAPADAAYADRRYEFWVRVDAQGEQFGVALVSRIRVHTVQARDTRTVAPPSQAVPGTMPPAAH